jgi:hypothetical protein
MVKIVNLSNAVLLSNNLVTTMKVDGTNINNLESMSHLKSPYFK